MKNENIKEKAAAMVAAENNILARRAAAIAAANKARRAAANSATTPAAQKGLAPLTPAQQALLTTEYTYNSLKSGKPVTITGYNYALVVTRNVCNNMGNAHLLHTAFSVAALAAVTAAATYTPQKGTTFLQWCGVVVSRKVSNFCRAQIMPQAAPGSVVQATTAGPLQALILKETLNTLPAPAQRIAGAILAAPGAFLALGATPHLRRGGIAALMAKLGYTQRQTKAAIAALKTLCQ